ncbi:MAG: helix-turn-helix transcriptional regulator [Mycobacteriaceae bacterium]|uniref:helix-turn-helix transcriptional regulator n=1 Tax=Corynebacterium sp. TaxID=1720 RepID=UPI003F9570F2
MTTDTFPASTVRGRCNRDEHVLLWVFSGTMTVSTTVTATVTHHLREGQGILVPAGVPRDVHVPAGSLAFPVFLPVRNIGELPATPTVCELGTGWNTWMLHHFVTSGTHIRSHGRGHRDMLHHLGGDAPVADLPVPRAEAARRVADELNRNPALTLTAGEWAASCAVSVRTLRRMFLRDTGLTFSRWRTRCRVLAAAEYLEVGHEVGWVANQVGFDSVPGFIRAFSSLFGQTPSVWGRTHGSYGAGSVSPSERVLRYRDDRNLAAALSGSALPEPASSTPPVPQSSARGRMLRGDVHALLWVYQGSARVTAGAFRMPVACGHGVWVPAGTPHTLEVDTDSVVLPLFFPLDSVAALDGVSSGVTEVSVPAEHSRLMMHHAVANLTLVRPDGYERTTVLDMLEGVPTGGVSSEGREEYGSDLPFPASDAARRIAGAVLDDPADSRTLAGWAQNVGVSPRALGREFRDGTGRTFTAWRCEARMRAAGALIRNGATVSAASRRVGYTHLSGFSRDFRRVFGVPPREFRGLREHGPVDSGPAAAVRVPGA